MLQWALSLLLLLNVTAALALEITINGAKEDYKRYSTLHLKDTTPFVCETVKNDFELVTKVICAYPKRPAKAMKTFQNDFFKVDTIVKNDTFFLVIVPFHKIRLEAVVFDLTKDESLYTPKVSLAKHWMLIAYEDTLPLLKKELRNSTSINFPFFMSEDKLPFVGALDMKGNPIHIKKVEDVTEYLRIKKFFKTKQYERSLELIEEILQEYPNTLFKAELIYYKIRIYKEQKDYDNVIENAKLFLREYSGDENIPEVLSLMAYSYSNIGLGSDADYFFDRLFNEHEESVYTKWGYIYKGEMLEAGGGTSAAIRLYKKALNETNNIDVAASAAYNLAHIRLGASNKESAKYIKKIAKAKPEFFMKDYVTSTEMMYSFADSEDYETAATIAGSFLSQMKPSDDDFEVLLKNRALWLAKTDDKKAALGAINEYFKLFNDGDYIQEIQVAKDAMFFEREDTNTTARLIEYDKLIDEYSEDSIGDRAIYEKAKLLLTQKQYQAVLAMQESLESLDDEVYKDIPSIISKAAVGVMELSLEKKKCNRVLSIANDYNITLSDDWDDGVYECAMKGGDYQLSRQIASKNLTSKDLEFRKKWLFRHIKIDFATGNYSDVIGASKDLITLIDKPKTSKYKEVYRILFDTYQRLEQSQNMIKAMLNIEKVYGSDYKDLDRYVLVMSIGSELKDDTIVMKYGEKALSIQESSKSNPQSPFLELTLYQTYINKEEYNKAYDVLVRLDNIDLRKEKRARQKYLLGTVLNKLWRDEEAQKAYKEAIEADPSSAWAELAKSALEL